VNYTEKQIEAFISGVYSGKYNASDNLPEDLYKAISDHLVGGLNKGLNEVDFGTKNEALRQELRDNVYMFSGAKTYQQVKEMSGLIADSSTFPEFKKKAMGVYDTYNTDWLRSEYNTAYGQGTIANQWGKIEEEKAIFPSLRYSAVMDLNTSAECRGFDGITLPVGDSFWDNYSPLNHFNCRCILEQVDAYSKDKTTSKKDRDAAIEIGNKGVDDTFKMNPYKDGYVFSPEHPYFKVATKDKAFAEENFGLPIPAAKQFDYDFKTMNEKEMAKAGNQMFKANGGIPANINFGTLGRNSARLRMDNLQELLNEYDLKQPASKWGSVDVTFNSTSKSLGQVSAYSDNFTISDINFGNRDAGFHRIFDESATILREKSAVDEVNLWKSTQVHEFAHVISISQQETMVTLWGKNRQTFWKEMRKINKEYLSEISEINTKIFVGDSTFADLYKVHLGKYAQVNLNEFMAEGFTEYKLKTNPSKYANKIGKLIDKHFMK
jgi:SPP1 gp7 family putative phage head morphogenesis protein